MGQAKFATGLKGPAKGMLSAMEGGVVGGLSNVAMGGDFWQGFTNGFENAGLSFVAADVAGKVKQMQEERKREAAERAKAFMNAAFRKPGVQNASYEKWGLRLPKEVVKLGRVITHLGDWSYGGRALHREISIQADIGGDERDAVVFAQDEYKLRGIIDVVQYRNEIFLVHPTGLYPWFNRLSLTYYMIDGLKLGGALMNIAMAGKLWHIGNFGPYPPFEMNPYKLFPSLGEEPLGVGKASQGILKFPPMTIPEGKQFYKDLY